MSEDGRRLDQNRMTALRRVDGLDLPGRLWADDDVPGVEDRYADLGTGLVSLAYLKAAIRRWAAFWCAIALVGLLTGVASYVAFPASYQATTSVWLTFGPYENPTTAADDDQLMAQSRAVGSIALHKLRLTESVTSFIAGYTAAALSPRVLQITVSAPSGNQALLRAQAVANAFLQYRANQLRADQELVIESIDLQIKQARHALAKLKSQIASLESQPVSATQQSELRTLQARQSQRASQLSSLEQGAGSSSIQTQTNLAIHRTTVLDAAALTPHSHLKAPLFHAAIGLVVGLALGLGIVVVRALISDRLRRRDDVSRALGAPVKLSVPKVRLSRWRPSRRGLAAAEQKDLSRVIMHLGSAVARSRRGFASLAVVPVDDVDVAAVCLASLAISCAQQGLRVVLADLCAGAPAARLLGVREAGVNEVGVEKARLVVAIPDRDDIYPAGPLRGRQHGNGGDGDLAVACESADLLFTLVALDPAIGGEHLSGWASGVVAFITAGRSSAERIKAVGEMIRLARIPVFSAVLIGADKTDQSLGVAPVPGSEYQPDGV